jgi:hypothetical protein
MGQRTCSRCGFVTHSQVAEACASCGFAGPSPKASGQPLTLTRLGFLATVALMVALGYASYKGDQKVGAAPRRPAVSNVSAPLTPATRAAQLLRALRDPSPQVRKEAAVALGELREPRAVEPLVVLLRDEELQWHAAQALVEIGGPKVEAVLMDALRREDYDVMAGAHRFYVRRGGPEAEKAMVKLLQKSNDLAVAQGLIEEGSPRLVAAARKWAASRGFELVKSPKGGYTWQEVK